MQVKLNRINIEVPDDASIALKRKFMERWERHNTAVNRELKKRLRRIKKQFEIYGNEEDPA